MFKNINYIEYKNLFKKKKIVEILLILTFIIQFGLTVYFNLKLIRSHMGYDSSWTYLKTAMISQYGTLTSDNWAEQTNVLFDSSLLLASFLYKITGHLFASYGLANILILICVLICFNSILNLLGISNISAKWFSLNLIICPYLTNGFSLENDLGYFSDLLSTGAFYNLRVLIFLLIVREYFYIKKNNKFDLLCIITFLLCVLAGTSSGIFIIVIVLLPYLLFLIEKVFLTNKLQPIFSKEAIFCYASAIFVIIGKLLAKYVLKFEAIDATRTWTPLTKFFTNFGATLLGFMKLLGVLPVDNADISILSKDGLCYIFPIFIFGVIIVSLVYAIKCIKTNEIFEKENIVFLINIILVNFLVFGLFNVQYGAVIFEERYLICTFMIIILLIGYYLQHSDIKLIFTKVLTIGLLVCLIANDFVSDKIYIETTNDDWQMVEIKTIVSSQDAELVYLWGDELLFLGRNMRSFDLNHVYKNINNDGYYHHWGDYLYYEDNSDYSGSTLLIIPNDSEIVPEYVLNYYVLLERLNSVSIYKSKSNPIDRAAGITGEISIDYPTSSRIVTDHGSFEGNSFISDGTAGYIMWGPNCATVNGTYDFTIEYSIISGDKAYFDIAIDDGEIQLGSADMISYKKSITIPNISLEEGHTLQYRVLVEEGTKVKINKIVINEIK